MARSTRRVVLPRDREQAIFRGMFLHHLRSKEQYQNIIRFDFGLREHWRTLVTHYPAAAAYPLVMLDEIQRGPTEARWLQAAPADFRDLVALFRGANDPDFHDYQQMLAELPASAALETYLTTAETFVTQRLRITDRGHVSWWALDGVHRDVAEVEPGDWIDGHDEWRVGRDPFAVHVRVDVIGGLYEARVICTDGRTGERLWEETHRPEFGERHLAFRNWDAVRRAQDRCTQGVKAGVEQHHQDAQMQRNTVAFDRMMNRELPALVTWHLTGKAPGSAGTRQYLRRLARNQLGIDPLPGEKGSLKLRPFLTRKPRNQWDDGNEA